MWPKTITLHSMWLRQAITLDAHMIKLKSYVTVCCWGSYIISLINHFKNFSDKSTLAFA